MNKKTAALIVLAACVLLAVLLATGALSHFLIGSIFAIVLVACGILSRGFSNR